MPSTPNMQLQRGLGRPVAAPAGVVLAARVGRDGHHPRAGAQGGQQLLHQREGGDRVHLDHPAQLLHRVAVERGPRAGAQRARVQHQGVQAPHAGRRPAKLVAVPGVGHVAGARHEGPAPVDLAPRLLQLAGAARVDHQAPAALGQRRRQRAAQAPRGPGDECVRHRPPPSGRLSTTVCRPPPGHIGRGAHLRMGPGPTRRPRRSAPRGPPPAPPGCARTRRACAARSPRGAWWSSRRSPGAARSGGW